MKYKKYLSISTVFYIAFISLFAFDSISNILGFLMHLIPTFILILLLLLSKKKPRLAGSLFILFGFVWLLNFNVRDSGGFILIFFPLVIIGSLFILSGAKEFKEFLKKGVFLGFILFILVFILTSVEIGYSVGVRCSQAKTAYSGNCSEALISYTMDPNVDEATKTRLLWALGQLADPSTKDILMQFKEVGICDPGDDSDECEYELDKAIKWVTTGRNIYSRLWRRLFL